MYSIIPEKALKWSYVPENNIDIENTGASFKVNVDGKGSCECYTKDDSFCSQGD